MQKKKKKVPALPSVAVTEFSSCKAVENMIQLAMEGLV
jgi:hypothetical protein